MEKFYESLILFLFAFVLIFIYYLVKYFIKRKQKKLDKMKEIKFLKHKYKIKDIDEKKASLYIGLTNSLIISLSGTLCSAISMNFYWQLALGFVLLMIFIYLGYNILGKILKKEGKDKNEHKRNRK